MWPPFALGMYLHSIYVTFLIWDSVLPFCSGNFMQWVIRHVTKVKTREWRILWASAKLTILSTWHEVACFPSELGLPCNCEDIPKKADELENIHKP